MNLIFDAFFQLLRDNPHDIMTVSALIKKSGVARSTFYRHFSSVDDVAEGYFRSLDDTFDDLTEGKVDFRDRDYLVKAFAIYQRIGHRILICENAGFHGRVIQAIVDYTIASIGDMPYGSSDRYELYYYAGAMFCVVSEWVASGMKETPEELADIFLRYASPQEDAASQRRFRHADPDNKWMRPLCDTQRHSPKAAAF
jgi:AcrR family transcriptional regulator